MTVVVVILILAIAAAIGAAVFYAVRSAGESATQRASAASATSSVPQRPRPTVGDFHVRGDTARVLFDVPLGDSEAGEHLTNLLAAAAIEYVHAKVVNGLPLEGVHKIDVMAKRGDQPELLRTVDLPSIGDVPAVFKSAGRGDGSHDPIAAVQAVVADASVSTPSSSSEQLESIQELIELSTPTEAHLRAIGVDTSTASLEDLVVGLFQVNGYDVQAARAGAPLASSDDVSAFTVARAGTSSVLVIHSHERGSHPELSDHILTEFAVGVAQANPTSAILVTDKFSPYSMYERERRDKRLVFVTRERLQAFVDSFGLS